MPDLTQICSSLSLQAFVKYVGWSLGLAGLEE